MKINKLLPIAILLAALGVVNGGNSSAAEEAKISAGPGGAKGPPPSSSLPRHTPVTPGDAVIKPFWDKPLAAVPSAGVAKTALVLAKGGVAKYVIAGGVKPIPAERTAERELADFLGKVTGVEFPIVPENEVPKGSRAIYVGRTAFAAGQGIDLSTFGPEEWLIRPVGDDLILAGGRNAGTVFAVFEFLEKNVGVHLLCPFTTVVPKRPDLAVAVAATHSRHAFMKHLMSYGLAAGPTFHPDQHKTEAARRRGLHFLAFNKNEAHPGYAWTDQRFEAHVEEYGIVPKWGSGGWVHTMVLYASAREYGESHPEFFALQRKADGTLFRDVKGLGWGDMGIDYCLTNPDLRQVVIQKLRKNIETDRREAQTRGRPAPFIYTVDAGDGLPDGCLCPNCRAVIGADGSESDLWVDFVNAIADNVKADYPDVLIRTLAYNHTLAPPRHARPRDNVLIWWCYNYGKKDFFQPITHEINRPLRELFDGWAAMTKNIQIYDYWSRYRSNSTPPGFYLPYSIIRTIQPDLQYYHNKGIFGFFASGDDWKPGNFYCEFSSFQPLAAWLGMKLTQDPDQDVERLLGIFFEGYYGPAAVPMRAYLDYLERRQQELTKSLATVPDADWYRYHLDLDFFVEANLLFDAALAACGDNAFYAVRVKRERLIADAALLHFEPALRRAYSVDGKPYPFDRAQILKRYRADWNGYLDAFWADGPIADARSLVEKNLKYMESMPLITRDDIRHRAVPVADAEIVVDGNLDEALWSKAEPLWLTLGPLDGTRELLARTAVRMLWSETHLYLGFECFDDRIGEMQYGTAGEAVIGGAKVAQLWDESSLELFFNPSGDRANYVQMIIDPAGGLEDAAIAVREGVRDFDWTWRSDARVAARVGEKSWVAEVVIPFAALGFAPGPGKTLVANFTRNRQIRGDAAAAQLTTWSPLTVGNHDLEQFGTIVLGESNVRP